MPDENPFPDSEEKAYLRRLHLARLLDLAEVLGRELNYFGLPSARMTDVAIWRSALRSIVAVERDEDCAKMMHRNAQLLEVRSKTTVLEMGLAEVARVLAADEEQASLVIGAYRPFEQKQLRTARAAGFDVVNLDLCGGFLYTRDGDQETENAKILKDLVRAQARHRQGFVLIVTFHTRDTGADDYNAFIGDTLARLREIGLDVAEAERFYTAERGQRMAGQPANLRRLRFAVPAFLTKIALDHFQVRGEGSWYYKTFYHAVFSFTPRLGRSSLGLTWPPIDELKDLLRIPMHKVSSEAGEITLEPLLAPSIP